MRILAGITAALLFTFMLASAPAFAQQDRPDQAQDQSKDQQQSKDKDKDKEKDKANEKNGAKQNDNTRQDQNRPGETKPEGGNARPENAHPENGHPAAARPQEQTRPEDRNQNMGGQEQSRPVQAQPEQRGGQDQHAAGGNRGRHIPDDAFRAHFGRGHHFHVQRAQIVNQAQPEFVYGGYTFELAQPWPGEWSYDDNCYVDYIDGSYYLYDLNHPGIQILVFVIE